MAYGNLLFVSAALGGSAGLFLLGLRHPHLMFEDGIVETAGAVMFAMAALLAFGRLALPIAPRVVGERLIFAGLGAFALLLFLSEISFGSRFFGFRMPQMHGGGEFDGGHDIFTVLLRWIESGGTTGWMWAGLGFGAVLAAGVAAAYICRARLLVLVRHVLASAFEFRLAVTLCMLGGAVALDLVETHATSILEEVLEFGASVALAAAVVALLRRSVRGPALRPPRFRRAPARSTRNWRAE